MSAQSPLEPNLTGGGRARTGEVAGRAVLVVPMEDRVWEFHDKPWDVSDEAECEDSYWPHDDQPNVEWSRWGIEWVEPDKLIEFVRAHWPEFDAEHITAKRLLPVDA
ncbi:hypothetical protein [Microbacterium oxydans]|uniref:hypothetical protein n=1 Tax=Microbacterium oxydans TaxID=82380 RepID=UPI0024AD475A|nr:hypothetical protein [Microbacterium oxydans]